MTTQNPINDIKRYRNPKPQTNCFLLAKLHITVYSHWLQRQLSPTNFQSFFKFPRWCIIILRANFFSRYRNSSNQLITSAKNTYTGRMADSIVMFRHIRGLCPCAKLVLLRAEHNFGTREPRRYAVSFVVRAEPRRAETMLPTIIVACTY